MSLNLYDKSLYNKIHDLFPNVINSSEDSALSDTADKNSEIATKEKNKPKVKISLPLISFWRTNNPPNFSEDGNYAHIRRGNMYDKDLGTKVAKFARTFPVNINYQVTIWSDRRKEVDDIYREFLMLFFVDAPYLRIHLNEDYYEDFSMHLMDSNFDVDTTSFSDKGRMYRQDIMIEIPNARMFYKKEFKLSEFVPIRVIDWDGIELDINN